MVLTTMKGLFQANSRDVGYLLLNASLMATERSVLHLPRNWVSCCQIFNESIFGLPQGDMESEYPYS